MALTTCPECGKEVSEKAKSCPNCGHPFGEGAQAKKKASLKTGSIIGLIGGGSFTLILAGFLIMGAITPPREPSSDLSVTVDVNSSAILSGLGVLCAVAATVVFIVALVRSSKLSRNAAIGVSVTALVLSVISLISIALYYNVLMICIGWLFLWEPVLEVVGSVKMLSNALKYEK